MDISKLPQNLLMPRNDNSRILPDSNTQTNSAGGVSVTLSTPNQALARIKKTSSTTEIYQPKPIYIQHSISNTTQNSEQTQRFANQLNDEKSDNRFKV
jgi:hypothetical protein